MNDTQEQVLQLSLRDLQSHLAVDGAVAGNGLERAIGEEQIQRAFERMGGQARVSVDGNLARVVWVLPPGRDLLAGVIEGLSAGQYDDAAIVLEFLLATYPDTPPILYNLGMAYSNTGRMARAATLLRRLVEIEPDHVNGRVALGVALLRAGQDAEGTEQLRAAVEADPANSWARRNLGGALLRAGRPEEAVEHLRAATDLNGSDAQTWFGLARALEATGDVAGAHEAYGQVVELEGFGDMAEAARQARARHAESSFRSAMPGVERMDAVMYCVDAMEKFDRMAPEEVQAAAFEIGALGAGGISMGNPDQRYHLRTLPGKFTGLHLVCLMYVGFKRIMPEADIGFDLAREYEAARALYKGEQAAASTNTE